MLNFDKSYPWNSILLLSVFSDVKVHTAVKKRERIKYKISFFLYLKKSYTARLRTLHTIYNTD